MAITGKMRPGKNSRIKANGAILNFSEWDTTDQADKLDSTNFESSGQGQGTIGIETVQADGKGLWDAHQNAYDSPPGLYPQDSFPSLQFFENLADNIFWNFPLFLILSAKNGARVREWVNFEFSGESNGPFARPTGSV